MAALATLTAFTSTVGPEPATTSMRPLVVAMSSVPPGDSGKLRVTVSVASSRAPDKAMSQAAVSDERAATSGSAARARRRGIIRLMVGVSA